MCFFIILHHAAVFKKGRRNDKELNDSKFDSIRIPYELFYIIASHTPTESLVMLIQTNKTINEIVQPTLKDILERSHHRKIKIKNRIFYLTDRVADKGSLDSWLQSNFSESFYILCLSDLFFRTQKIVEVHDLKVLFHIRHALRRHNLRVRLVIEGPFIPRKMSFDCIKMCKSISRNHVDELQLRNISQREDFYYLFLYFFRSHNFKKLEIESVDSFVSLRLLTLVVQKPRPKFFHFKPNSKLYRKHFEALLDVVCVFKKVQIKVINEEISHELFFERASHFSDVEASNIEVWGWK